MALPARGSATMARMARGDASRNTDALAEKMEEMKGVLNRLLFKVSTNTKDSADHLAKIKGQAVKINKSMGDLEAAAELQLDELVAIKEGLPGYEGGDEPGEGPGEEPDGEKVDPELLKEIKENTQLTAERVGELLDIAKEGQEEVLVNPGQPTDTGTGGGDQPGGKPEGKDQNDIKKGFNTLIGGYIGIIAGLFMGWVKALGTVLKGIVKVFSGFGKFFKGIFSGKAAGKLTDVFKSIGKFMKMLGSVFGRIFGFLKPIVQIAGSVAKTVSKIFAPLLLLFGAFEGIKGAIEGFMNTEGSLFDKIIGGLIGAVRGIFDFLISAPANLIKNIIGWIAGLFGFDGVKEKLASFEFSFDGLLDAIFGFFGGIKDWILGGLKNLGIPPFEFTIPVVGKKIKFDGWFPFAGEEGGTSTEADTGGDPLEVDMGATEADNEISKYKQEVAAQEAAGEVMAVKLPSDFAKKELQGKKAVVTGETFRGGYKMITEDGKKVRIGPALRKEVDSILEGGEEVGGELQQGDPGTADGINTATTAANMAADDARSGGSSSMTSTNVVNSPTNSQQSTSIYYGDNDNSLGSRAAVVLPG